MHFERVDRKYRKGARLFIRRLTSIKQPTILKCYDRIFIVISELLNKSTAEQMAIYFQRRNRDTHVFYYSRLYSI